MDEFVNWPQRGLDFSLFRVRAGRWEVHRHLLQTWPQSNLFLVECLNGASELGFFASQVFQGFSTTGRLGELTSGSGRRPEIRRVC